TEADTNVDTGVLEVECVSVALRAVADDGDFLCLDKGEVCVCVVICLCHVSIIYFRLVEMKVSAFFALLRGSELYLCAYWLRFLVETIALGCDRGKRLHTDGISAGGDEPFV